MWVHGQTKNGKTRWYCKLCRTTAVKTRNDVTMRLSKNLALKWLRDGIKLKVLAKMQGMTIAYIQKKISIALAEMVIEKPVPHVLSHEALLLDATWIVNKEILVLIAATPKRVVYWKFESRETQSVWNQFLAEIRGMPAGIVSDAHKGLVNAVSVRFPELPHQRCLAHIIRQSKLWITQHPKTQAGRELSTIIERLIYVDTDEDEKLWRSEFEKWTASFESFLNEKSHYKKRSWFTHRRLRAVRSLITNALPFLFLWRSHSLPKTTNHLEGGLNGPLKFLFKEHRGLSTRNKIAVTNLFLFRRVKTHTK